MIKIQNLRFRYPKSKVILDDVSLSFESGNIYGLFGRNGEGKSTLMKIMTGLLFPKGGSCQVFGENVSRKHIRCLQEVFFIPEDFELAALKISKYEEVNSVFYPQFSKEQFYELIKEFHLSPDENIATLSFGQKKKVLIAFGIATNTKLLLLDEPTNGLDIPSKSQFRKIIAKVADQGKCIVIATHQVRDLHSLINHLMILDQSKVVFDESLFEVSEHLWFGKPTDKDKHTIIYDEPSLGGKAVLPKLDKDETDVDLELLFNAVLNESNRINQVLKKRYHDVSI
ncbi:ABC transporter ATP-binding protein [Aquimarina sp. BL5]|uniref:ABC transporter ATP-binding protein n=1 Tax=Aquimarina sp. BL5 TaxID=1714860 RepID=UPI000E4A31D8|nr:ABC transporter ATP-binding protein [Aquimarina sp. BL5]AXT53310.1 ABC transporter ATP-binding protein [Aquimarina sp. BL5]RKN02767.1 ATP-binding cassette domain-containing protein [Aquimarina sp. BL5]